MEAIADSYAAAFKTVTVVIILLIIGMIGILFGWYRSGAVIGLGETFTIDGEVTYTCQINEVEDKLLLLCMGGGQ